MGIAKAVVQEQVASSSVEATPIGTLLSFAGDTAPINYLICTGQLVSTTTYADLFAVIGHKYNNNVDPGGGQFRLPSNGRVLVGQDTGQTEFNTVGKTGGAKTVALTPTETPLRAHSHSGTTGTISADHSHSGTTADINQNHTHSGSTGGISANHTHNVTYAQISNTSVAGGGTRITDLWGGTNNYTTGTVSSDHGHSFTTGTVSSGHTHNFGTSGVSANHTHAFTTGNPSVAEANGTGHNNLQPYQVVTFIIRYQ